MTTILPNAVIGFIGMLGPALSHQDSCNCGHIWNKGFWDFNCGHNKPYNTKAEVKSGAYATQDPPSKAPVTALYMGQDTRSAFYLLVKAQGKDNFERVGVLRLLRDCSLELQECWKSLNFSLEPRHLIII